jgi:hypothetical protein
MQVTAGYPLWAYSQSNVGIRRYFSKYEGTPLGPYRNFEIAGPLMRVNHPDGY